MLDRRNRKSAILVNNRSNSTMNSAVATRYTDTLKPEAKARYLEKTSILEGIDPYEIVSGADFVTTCEFPPVESSDIVSYLVLQTSFISAQQFKARKSLEAFNQFISGWIKDVKAWKIHGKCVVTGKVSYTCWVVSFFNAILQAVPYNSIGETLSEEQ